MTTAETVENIITEIIGKFNPYDIELQKTVAIDIANQIDTYNESNGSKPTPLEIAQAVIAMNGSVLVRDYVMGLPKEKSIQAVSTWLSYVIDNSPEPTRAPMCTIKSTYCQETGDKAGAKFYLEEALKANEDYSLAKLLKRVYNTPNSDVLFSFKQMREDLHDKVKEELGL